MVGRGEGGWDKERCKSWDKVSGRFFFFSNSPHVGFCFLRRILFLLLRGQEVAGGGGDATGQKKISAFPTSNLDGNK